MIQKDDKKEKYIRQVCRNLRFSHEMKKRVESDLRTDIELRLESGKNMDDIIRELGTPREAAAYFNQEMAEEKKPKFSGDRGFFLAAAVITLVLIVCSYISSNQVNEVLKRGTYIVGAADGPTSVFITGRINDLPIHRIWGVVIIISFLSAIYLFTGHGKNRINYAIAIILSVAGILFSLLGIIYHLPFFELGNTVQVTFSFRMLFSRMNTLLIWISLILALMLAFAIHKRKK